MLSGFIVTLLYPFHTRQINCANMQYFHLNSRKEGPRGMRGKGLFCCLSDNLAVTVRCLFLTETAHWDRANTISQLVNLCMSFIAWSQKTWWAKPSSGSLVPDEVKAPGLTPHWSHHEWQCHRVCPGDKYIHNQLTEWVSAIYWWWPRLG